MKSLTTNLCFSHSTMEQLSAKAQKFEPGRKTHPPKENYYSAVLSKVQKERDVLVKEDKKIMKEDKKIMKETINMFESEVARLKNEVKDLRANSKEVKGAYKKAREEIADLKKELSLAESANDDLIEMNQVVRDECDYYRERNFALNQEVSDLEHRLIFSTQPDNRGDGFMEATLKMKFIFDEIKKIGALPEDHQEWIYPLIEEIKIPEVSQELKERILPSDEYDPQDDDGDEFDQRERIQEWNDEEETEDKMPYGLRLLFAQDIAKANRYVKLMQSAVRKYLENGSHQKRKDRAAVIIQKIWRRYNVKPIKVLDSLGGSMGKCFWLSLRNIAPYSLRVRFINTGDVTACVQKISLDSVLSGRLYHVPPVSHHRVSFSPDLPESFEYFSEEGTQWSDLNKVSLSCKMTAYQGDWYQVKFMIYYTDSGKTEKIKYLQIPPRILTRVVEDVASYYYSCSPIEYTIDLNTGICLKDIDDIRDLLTCQSASEMNSSSMVNVFRKRWDLPLLY